MGQGEVFCEDWIKHENSLNFDILAEILRPISLLEMVGAEIYLSETLGIKVDLVPKRSVREELRDNILEETVSIWQGL